MKILQIANKAIFPPDGGVLAILNLAKGYIQNGHQVHLLNMVSHKHSNHKSLIEPEYNQNLKVTGIDVNTKLSPLKLILNLFFSKKAYISERFVNKKFRDTLLQLLHSQSYDVIQFEGLYTLQYIPFIKKYFDVKTIYRPHNVEYLIWEKNSDQTRSFLKKLYFKITSNRLKLLEKKLLNSYDFIAPITSKDFDLFNKLGNSKPGLVTPFGIDLNKIPTTTNESNKSEQSILYIGALDWIPNQQGLIWFMENCLPIILDSLPEVKFKIAGRNAPRWLIKKFKHINVEYMGEVTDSSSFIQQNGPFIVPLFSGSGMRVKIIEAMALQKAIVATDIAVEGIECKDQENILLANDPREFSDSVVESIKNLDLQKQLGKNAHHFIANNYNFTDIATRIINHIS